MRKPWTVKRLKPYAGKTIRVNWQDIVSNDKAFSDDRHIIASLQLAMRENVGMLVGVTSLGALFATNWPSRSDRLQAYADDCAVFLIPVGCIRRVRVASWAQAK